MCVCVCVFAFDLPKRASSCEFGEVRLTETALMEQFGMTAEVLPKIIAFRNSGSSKEVTFAHVFVSAVMLCHLGWCALARRVVN